MLGDIKKTLWATADKLRANMDVAEYKHLMVGLILVKHISDTFAGDRAVLALLLIDGQVRTPYAEPLVDEVFR